MYRTKNELRESNYLIVRSNEIITTRMFNGNRVFQMRTARTAVIGLCRRKKENMNNNVLAVFYFRFSRAHVNVYEYILVQCVVGFLETIIFMPRKSSIKIGLDKSRSIPVPKYINQFRRNLWKKNTDDNSYLQHVSVCFVEENVIFFFY